MHITTNVALALLWIVCGRWAWKRAGRKHARKRERRAAYLRLVALHLL